MSIYNKNQRMIFICVHKRGKKGAYMNTSFSESPVLISSELGALPIIPFHVDLLLLKLSHHIHLYIGSE